MIYDGAEIKKRLKTDPEFAKAFKKRKKVYAYLRESTDDQDHRKFYHAVNQYCTRMKLGRPIFVVEHISGKLPIDKRKIGWIIEQEDCLHILAPEQTRLGRSSYETQKIWKICESKGISVHCIKENLLLDPFNLDIDKKFSFDISGAFGEREGAYISIRTKEGLYYAKHVKGVRLGKPLDKYEKKLKDKIEEISDMYEDGMTKDNIAEHYKINRRTLYRFLEDNQEEITTYCRNKDYGRNPSRKRRRSTSGGGRGGSRRRGSGRGGRRRNSVAVTN